MKVKAYIYLLLTALIWGMSFVWSNQLILIFRPETVVFMRLCISSVLLALISQLSGKLQKLRRQHIGWFLLLSLFYPFLYFIGEGYGIKYTSASVSAILIATIPLITPFGAALFFKEKLKKMNLAGLLVSFVGVLVIVGSDGFSATASVVGILYLTGAVLTASGYYLLLKKVADHYNSFTVATYQNLLGIIMFAPLIFWDGGSDLQHFSFSVEIMWPLLALSVLASSLAFVLNTSGVRMVGPTRSAAFTNAIPVFTAVFSYFILHEALGWVQLTGMLIVLCGLVLSQTSGKFGK